MDNKFLKSNEIKYYISTPLHSCGIALVGTGSIIQGFLLKCGVSGESVAFYVSAMLIVQMIAMLLMSGAVESMKGIIKVSAALTLFQLPLLAALFFFSSGDAAPDVVYGVVFATGAFASVFYGIYGVLSYKLPYKIMDIKEYGRILGISGIFLGLFSTLFSFIISFFTDSDRFDYFGSMRIFFLIGVVLFLLSAIVSFTYGEVPDLSKSDKKSDKINIFRYKPFYVLLMPNLLRGFHTGVWGVILVIGNDCGIVSGEKGALLTVLLQLALMLGCFVYSAIAKKAEHGKLILLSSLAVALLTPVMLAGSSSKVFLAFYLIVSIIKNFIDYGVPTAITKIVDYRCIGQYSAWRMVLHTLGTAVGGAVVPYLTASVGALMTLIIAGICQAVSGLVYWLYMRQLKDIA